MEQMSHNMAFEESIDVHAHFLPSFYREALERNGHSKVDGMPGIPQWNEEAHIALMEDLPISKSIISISSPGCSLVLGDDAANRKLARECNEFAGDLKKRRPSQFGFWAALPLPDVAGSLAEISYVLDDLQADGIGLHTNHHGIYLGDPAFDDIFQELNRRKATVFIHPSAPCMRDGKDGHTHVTANPLPQYPAPTFEFMFDTARAVINLFQSGTLARCPAITFVIPHAGGALSFMLQRYIAFVSAKIIISDINMKVIKETFARQFYFDLAGFPFPDQIFALLNYIGPDRLLYGSDFPFTPHVLVARLSKTIPNGLKDAILDESGRNGIYAENARRLLSIKH